MNVKPLLLLAAAALFVACADSALISGQSHSINAAAAPVAVHIVDLPAVTVRPAVEDLAFYQANKIVDLATVTVRPDTGDLAFFLADHGARIVDLPVVTVRPSADDTRFVAIDDSTLVPQLAAR